MSTTLLTTLALGIPDTGSIQRAVLHVLCLIACVSVHEFGHAYVADRLGDPLPRQQGRVTLNPLSHIDPIGTVIFPFMMALGFPLPLGWGKPVQWTGHPRYLTRRFSMRTIRLMVSVAGPAMNLLLALVLSALFVLTARLGQPNGLLLSVIGMNLGLMVFNLLPIPPLDGRSFLEFLPRALSPVSDFLTRYGSFVFLALIMIPGPLGFIMSPLYDGIRWYTMTLIHLAGG